MLEHLDRCFPESDRYNQPTSKCESVYVEPINTMIGSNIRKEDIDTASAAGFITNREASLLSIFLSVAKSIGFKRCSAIPGIKYRQLYIPSARSLIVESKRFLKYVRFDSQEITNILKCDKWIKLLKSEVKTRQKANKYVSSPDVIGSSFVPTKSNSPPYYIEKLITGTQLFELNKGNQYRYVDILFSDLSNWYKSSLQRKQFKEYTESLVTKIINSNIYPEVKELVDPILSEINNENDTTEILTARVHGDLNSRNLVVTDDEIYVLDWELSQRQSIMHDIYNFCIHWTVFDGTNSYIDNYISQKDIDKFELFHKTDLKLYLKLYALEKMSRIHNTYEDKLKAKDRIQSWGSVISNELSIAHS